MSVAARPGDGVGPFARVGARLTTGRLGWWLLACLTLALAGWSHAAQAGIYRCQGPHGEVVFTSRPHDYKHCKPVDAQPQTHLGYAGAARVSSTGKAPARRAAGPVVLRGAVYRVVRADGSVEYTNVPPGHRRGHRVTRLFTYIETCFACALHSSINWHTVPLNLAAYRIAVRKAAKASGVKPAFLRAIIHAESAFNPNALSSKGAQGLMQLMPATASSVGVDDAFNASENIAGGARYLAELLKEFHGNHKLAAAAYNAGPQAVRKYGGVPPYAQTQVYVKRVGILYRRYQKALGG
ncbi:MAG TPA: lytic transglycosylase domain-containing protein [Rhodanobacteraceae bacterium]